jgi:Ca2+-binding EF-hand superfamily protein
MFDVSANTPAEMSYADGNLRALGITVKAKELPEVIETLDPGDDKYVTYEHFLAYAALYRHHNNEDDEERQVEVREAYALFTNNHAGPITLRDLKRIAKILKEDVSDDVLKDMLCEANGEGKDGWRTGVSLEDFEGVMKRAGVFG